MTKEELEKEAEEKAEEKADIYVEDKYDEENDCFSLDYARFVEGYLAGAEPREKQIQIDAEQIRALQKQNGELTDRVRELENKLENIRYYLDNEIPHELINEATTIIYKMV